MTGGRQAESALPLGELKREASRKRTAGRGRAPETSSAGGVLSHPEGSSGTRRPASKEGKAPTARCSKDVAGLPTEGGTQVAGTPADRSPRREPAGRADGTAEHPAARPPRKARATPRADEPPKPQYLPASPVGLEPGTASSENCVRSLPKAAHAFVQRRSDSTPNRKERVRAPKTHVPERPRQRWYDSQTLETAQVPWRGEGATQPQGGHSAGPCPTPRTRTGRDTSSSADASPPAEKEPGLRRILRSPVQLKFKYKQPSPCDGGQSRRCPGSTGACFWEGREGALSGGGHVPYLDLSGGHASIFTNS